jgi:hypothetical protein
MLAGAKLKLSIFTSAGAAADPGAAAVRGAATKMINANKNTAIVEILESLVMVILLFVLGF